MGTRETSQNLRVRAQIEGRVQGVFFRAWARDRALDLGLKGWVRNLPDGRVELLAEGPQEILEQIVADCHQGPPAAQVIQVQWQWEASQEEFPSFEIRY